MIIRSFYFRNEEEITAVKALLTSMRNKPTPAKQEKTTDESFITAVILPDFVEEVLNGGAYPEPYDCTKEESKILHNPSFLNLYQKYRTTPTQQGKNKLRIEINNLINSL